MRRTLRDIAYHPEKHLSDDGDLPAAVRDVIVAKRRWVETVPTPALARRRCHEIRAANIRLAGHAAPEVRDLEFQVAALGQAVKAWRVLAARTHPWCFFPEKTLRSFLLLENA